MHKDNLDVVIIGAGPAGCHGFASSDTQNNVTSEELLVKESFD